MRAESPLISVLILTHGGVAPELLAAARIISGELKSFDALSLEWTDGFDQASRRVRDVLDSLDPEQGILILTDILGGTPFNVAMKFREPGKVEIISGVNLPMVVRLGCLINSHMPLKELAPWIRDKGRSSICCSEDLPLAVRPFIPCEEADD